MKTKLAFLVLFLFPQLVASQYIYTIEPSADIEYEYRSTCNQFFVGISHVWVVVYLMNNTTYTFQFDDPANSVYDGIVYEPDNMTNWEVIDDENPYCQYWKWTGPSYGYSCFNLEFWIDDYSDVEVGMEDQIWFSIVGSNFGYINTEIVTSMDISGPYLDCSNPVQYSLQNLATGGFPSWTIKQNGYTKASGYGTTASASNLSNGEFEVKFSCSFPCNMNTLYFTENNWFGVPDPEIWGSDEIYCDFYEWYFVDNDSRDWGDFDWSTSYHLNIIGSTSGYKAKIEPDIEEDDVGCIYLEVTNACGTGYDNKYVDIICGFFMMIPNPADDYVDVVADQSKISATELSANGGYQVNIYDTFGALKTNKSTKNSTLRIDTSKLPDGIYVMNIIYNGKTYSKELVIKH